MKQKTTRSKRGSKRQGGLRVSTCLLAVAAFAVAWYSLLSTSGHDITSSTDISSDTSAHPGLSSPSTMAMAKLRLDVLRREVDAKTNEMADLMATLGHAPPDHLLHPSKAEDVKVKSMSYEPQKLALAASASPRAATTAAVGHESATKELEAHKMAQEFLRTKPKLDASVAPIAPTTQVAPEVDLLMKAAAAASLAADTSSSTDSATAVTAAAPPFPTHPRAESAISPPKTPPVAHRSNPILHMDDATFRTTPLDQLLALYGPGSSSGSASAGNSNGAQRRLLRAGPPSRHTSGGRARSGGSGGQCDDDFGVGLADRWRASRKECCHPHTPASNLSSSTLQCHFISQSRHHGAGDQLMLGTNVRLQFRDLVDEGGKLPKQYFKKYVQTKHNQEWSKLKWSKGTLAGTCTPDEQAGFVASHFPGWNANYHKSFLALPPEPEGSSGGLQCDVWVDEPTLLLERDTFANLFHNSEDFFNTFLALAILRWPVANLQVLLTDLFPPGPFAPLWTKVFRGRPGQSPEPLFAHDLARKYGDKKVCFKQLAVAILGAAAPIAVASWDTPCRGVALVRAYADFVVRALGLQHANVGRHRLDVNVTYAARKASVQWPERAFCDTQHSYFDCSQLGHLQTRKLGRMVKNDKEVLASLRKNLEGATFPNGARVRVREVDFSTLSFEEQIYVDATTDVMIGPHGAGLMHNVFMPDRAALIELFVDGSSANRHFHNLAFWRGHDYQGEPQSNPLNVGNVVRMAKSAVSRLDLSEQL